MDTSSVALSSLREDQVFVLSGQQLRQIIAEALLEAQGSQIEAQNEVLSMRQKIDALEIKISDQDKIIELRTLEIAQDRRRIAKLEQPHKPKDSRLLDELYKTMQARGLKQTDFATAARMVKRSKARMLQLKGEIGEDMRFMLVPSESHSQKVIIRRRD